MSLIFFNKDKIVGIFNIIDKDFWNISDVDNDTRIKVYTFAKRIKQFMMIYVFNMIVACIFFVTVPILTNSKILPLPLYYFLDEKQSPCYEIIIVIQAYLLVYNAPIINGAFDCLFAGLMVNLLTQIHILKYKLRILSNNCNEINQSLRTDEDIRSLKTYIRHHCLLIEFGEEMQRFYTGLILLQYTAALLATSFTFVILEFLRDISILNFFTYIAAHMAQLFMYCFFGSQYSYEFQSLSIEAYKSGWYTYANSNLTNGLRMLMMRAQNMKCFTAGYVIDLNLGNFINIIRFSFSVRTLLASKANVFITE